MTQHSVAAAAVLCENPVMAPCSSTIKLIWRGYATTASTTAVPGLLTETQLCLIVSYQALGQEASQDYTYDPRGRNTMNG